MRQCAAFAWGVIGGSARADPVLLAQIWLSANRRHLRHGLLHPVVIKSDGTLIAGHRRLEAARSLGWEDIAVTVIEVEDLLSAERDENAERKDFTPTEAVAIGKLLEEQHQAKIDAKRHDAKVAAGIKSAQIRGAKINHVTKRGNTISSAGLIDNAVGRTNKVVGRAVGMGASTYRRAKLVVEAAESNPKNFGDLPQQMDETGNVSGTHRELQRRRNPSHATATRARRRLK